MEKTHSNIHREGSLLGRFNHRPGVHGFYQDHTTGAHRATHRRRGQTRGGLHITGRHEKVLDAIPGLRSIAEFVFYATILAITIPGLALAVFIAATFIAIKTLEFLVYHPEFVTWIN